MRGTIKTLAVATAAAMAATACSTVFAKTAASGADSRGDLVAKPVLLRALTKQQTASALQAAEFQTGQVRYGVVMYRLVYRTVDPRGRRTTASGLLVLPSAPARHPRLVSFTHGTESYKGDAPSMGQDSFSSAPAVTFASAGFAAVTPDYLGLGVSPGPPPWMDVPSETTASLDMLRAARHVLVGMGRSPQRRVLVSGFSQGASAALGLARALEQHADRWLRLDAVAPISGAYDFRRAEIPALLSGQQIPPPLAVAYTSYLLTSWNRLHPLYASPDQIFRQPYASRVERLFDGNTPGQEMLAALPPTLDQLLTPRGLDLLRHPTPAFARALSVADATCANWRPTAPIRLYYAAGDEQAVTANTTYCRAGFAASGTAIQPIDLGPHDYEGSRHLGTEVTGTTAVLNWFTHLRPRR